MLASLVTTALASSSRRVSQVCGGVGRSSRGPLGSRTLWSTSTRSRTIPNTAGRSFAAAAASTAVPASPPPPRPSASSLTPRGVPTNFVKAKPRIVILGSGWGGYTVAKRLDKTKYDVRVISPANHFLFTPLLPSTAVGTLEFRAIQEPIRTIPHLGKYYQAKAHGLDSVNKVVHCEGIFKQNHFDVAYDYLIVSAGNKTNTFGIPGIAAKEVRGDRSSVLFLKHLYHARAIRNRILECFERASANNVTAAERSRLLSFIVVGGGPTSCEFTTELYDFIHDDVSQWYPDLQDEIQLTLVEAGPGLLPSFHQSLSAHYLQRLQQRKVHVKLDTAVTGVHDAYFPLNERAPTTSPNTNNRNKESDWEHEKIGRTYTVAKFNDGTELPFGMMVWSAGLAPVKFLEDCGLPLKRGRIEVDEYLRVPGSQGRILAIGDNAIINKEEKVLPPTASVAEQQGYYISDCFNNYYDQFDITRTDNINKDVPLPGNVVPALLPWEGKVFEFLNRFLSKHSPKFEYKNRGSMAVMGFGGGVVDNTNSDLPVPKVASSMSGLAAFIMWRSAYWTKQVSYTNKILIPMYWFKQMVFGRDISRF